MNGLGGIGKTTIAKKYVARHLQDKQFDHICWIDYQVSLKESLIDQIDHTYDTKEYSQEVIYTKIISDLNNFKGNNLLVIDGFDNDDDSKNIRTLPLNFKILITSRNNLNSDNIKVYRIDTLPLLEAKKLFYKHLYNPQNENQKILKKVKLKLDIQNEEFLLHEVLEKKIDCHTLTIEIMAKTMAKDETVTIKDLLNLKGEINVQVNHPKVGKSTLEDFLMKLFNLGKISKKGIFILQNLSILPSVDISQITFFNILQLKKRERPKYINALHQLADKGWLIKTTKIEDGKSINYFRCHQIIQTLILKDKDNKPRLKNCIKSVESFTHFLYFQSEERPIDMSLRIPFSISILENLQENNEILEVLANNVSLYYREIGDFDNALEYTQKALRLTKNLEDITELKSYITQYYIDAGNFSSALKFLQKAIDIEESVFGKNEPTLADSYYILALNYQEAFQFSRAIEYAIIALKLFEAKYDKDHPRLATLYYILADLYKEISNNQKANDFERKFRTIHKESIDDREVTDPVNTNIDLANYCKLNGDFENALEYAKKTLEVQTKRVGKENPELISTYKLITDIYLESSNYELALEYTEKILKIQENRLDENNIDLMETYYELSDIYLKLNEYDLFLYYAKEALFILKTKYEAKHPLIGDAYSRLGWAFYTKKDFFKALKYAKKAIKIRKENYINNPSNIKLLAYMLDSNQLLEMIYSDLMGYYYKALQYSKRSLLIGKKIYDAYDLNLAILFANVAMCYFEEDNYTEALVYKQKALKIYEKIYINRPSDLAYIYNDIANIYQRMGNFIHALTYAQKELFILEKLPDVENSDLIDSYTLLTDIYKKLENETNSSFYAQKLNLAKEGLLTLYNLPVMDITSIQSSFNDKKRFYLELLITNEKISAVILQNFDNKIIQFTTHIEYFSKPISKLSYREIIKITGIVIHEALNDIDESLRSEFEIRSTILGIKESWTDNESSKIAIEYLGILKRICDAFKLTPIGFVIISKAIVYLLNQEENKFLSTILTEIDQDEVTLTLVKEGNVFQSISGSIQKSVMFTIDNFLIHSTIPILPSQFILLLEKNKKIILQNFIFHEWNKSLPFNKSPQSVILSEGYDVKAVSNIIANYLGFELEEIVQTLPISVNTQNEYSNFISNDANTLNFPLSYLKVGNKADRGDINKIASRIEKTCYAFDLPVRIAEVNLGSSETQYCLEIALGTKLSSITTIAKDLAVAVDAPLGKIYMEAPIPGSNLIGIYIPNWSSEIVTLHSLLSSSIIKESKSKLTIALGLNNIGAPVIEDIINMSHLLIAGEKESGKSILLHSLIVSLLFRASPQDVKLILIDPKNTDLSLYNDIPYLLTPVITDLNKAFTTLKWLKNEMAQRYSIFLENSINNISSYNKLKGAHKLPFIVVIIDDVADLIRYNHYEIENIITQLTRLASETGIHLVLASQDPTSEIISNQIKSNIPTKIGFSFPTLDDYTQKLNIPNAKLLQNNGDMLYYRAGQLRPTQIKGAYISKEEIIQIVSFIKEHY